MKKFTGTLLVSVYWTDVDICVARGTTGRMQCGQSRKFVSIWWTVCGPAVLQPRQIY